MLLAKFSAGGPMSLASDSLVGEEELPALRRCSGMTRGGDPCNKRPTAGGSFCAQHDPERDLAKPRKRSSTFGWVRRLPSGRYQAGYTHEGRRYTAPDTFSTKADAHAYLSGVETDLRRGDWIDPDSGRETFGDYGRRWLTERVDLRPTTRELYEGIWRRWLEPHLGDVPLAALTVEMWRTWYAEQTAAHPGSTQPGKAYRLARAILNTAVDDGRLKSNPCRVKGAGREHAAGRPIAMPDQVACIASEVQPDLQLMVLLAAYCSLRIGELAGLRRKRIDLLHRTITVEEQVTELAHGGPVFGPPKTAAGRRVVALPPDLVPIVEAHLDAFVAPDPEALAFHGRDGRPIRRTKFRVQWTRACQRAGVEGLHFHDLRGSGATWAATSGATVRELMARLGHTTPTVALRYQHATLDRDHAIAENLGALFRSADSAAGSPTNVTAIDDAARRSHGE